MKVLDDNLEFTLLAQGNTAEVYNYDYNKVLKLFRENMPVEAIRSEYEKDKCIQLKLNNIPKAYELIIYRERYGIVYEKIIGTNMIDTLLKKSWLTKHYSKSLANIHSKLHKVNLKLDISVKDKLSSEIDAVSDLSEEEKDKIKEYMWNLPDGNVLCHFDFHPGNIIIQDKESIIIDWMTACIGNPNADVARTYLLFHYGELQHINRFANKVILLFKKYMGKIYIKEYKRCNKISNHDFEQWLLPVAAGRLIEWISDNEKEQLLKFIRKELLKLT